MENLVQNNYRGIRRQPAAQRNQEIVTGGFDGYMRVACSAARRRYAFAFAEQEERHQAAALAACIALKELGPDSTLNQVARLVQRILYREAKAQGWRIEGYRRADTGQKSTRWIKPERTYGGEWDARINQEGRF